MALTEPSRLLRENSPTRSLILQQAQEFKWPTLHIGRPVPFAVSGIEQTLRAHQGQKVAAADIGADKISIVVFDIAGTKLVPGKVITHVGPKGRGFLKVLEGLSEWTNGQEIPVGVSFAGPVENSQKISGTNLDYFMRDLGRKYEGDLTELFNNVVVVNDALAGSMASAYGIIPENPDIQYILYFINGGGIGGSIYSHGVIYPMEPGHVRLIEEFILRGKNGKSLVKPCGKFGLEEACVERAGSSGQGIEYLYYKLTGEKLTGKEISKRYQQGDKVARNLYERTAIIAASTVLGVGKTFGMFYEPELTAIVFHGGSFRVPHYGSTVQRIVKRISGTDPRVFYTKNSLSVLPDKNPCLDGAALAAVQHLLAK